jgi:hypothetical protein
MITAKSLVDGVNLTNTAATYYTAGDNVRTIITKATFVNDDTSAVTVTINLVPSAGSASYANRITKSKSLAAGETWSCSDLVSHVIEANGFISMLASVDAKIGCRISGYEVT